MDTAHAGVRPYHRCARKQRGNGAAAQKISLQGAPLGHTGSGVRHPRPVPRSWGGSVPRSCCSAALRPRTRSQRLHLPRYDGVTALYLLVSPCDPIHMGDTSQQHRGTHPPTSQQPGRSPRCSRGTNGISHLRSITYAAHALSTWAAGTIFKAGFHSPINRLASTACIGARLAMLAHVFPLIDAGRYESRGFCSRSYGSMRRPAAPALATAYGGGASGLPSMSGRLRRDWSRIRSQRWCRTAKAICGWEPMPA